MTAPDPDARPWNDNVETSWHWTPNDAPATPPASGPPPPTGPARASFGMTDGPISAARPEPASPAAPRSRAGADAGVRSPAGPDAGVRSPAGPDAGPRSPADMEKPAKREQRDTLDGPVEADTGEGPAAGDQARRPTADDGVGRPEDGAEWRTTAGWLTGERAPVAPPGATGGIGEVISGPGREIRPHRATRGPAPEVVPQRGARRRSRLAVAATVALSTIVLLGGAVAGVVFFAGAGSSLASVLRLGSGETHGKVATAPLGGRRTASFELVAATTKVTVRSQDLGDELYRITSAGDSGTTPSPVLTEKRVQLLLAPDGAGASGVVEVVLSSKVTWGLRFVGGADEQIVNFAGGRISGLDLVGGSRRVDLTLPVPAGTVPVRVTGAIEDFSVTSPAGNPVRVHLDSGAKTVAAGDRTLRDVVPGSTLTPKNWQVPNRYDVDAVSHVILLSVRTAD